MTREDVEWILSIGRYPFEIQTTQVKGDTFSSITSVGKKHYAFFLHEDGTIIATTKCPENFNKEEFLSHFNNESIKITLSS
jgi:hypothetical protein